MTPKMRAGREAEPLTPAQWAWTRAGHLVELGLAEAADPPVMVTGDGWDRWYRAEDVPGLGRPWEAKPPKKPRKEGA
jgi:hypothetical protein